MAGATRGDVRKRHSMMNGGERLTLTLTDTSWHCQKLALVGTYDHNVLRSSDKMTA